jgi:hypothetical protein
VAIMLNLLEYIWNAANYKVVLYDLFCSDIDLIQQSSSSGHKRTEWLDLGSSIIVWIDPRRKEDIKKRNTIFNYVLLEENNDTSDLRHRYGNQNTLLVLSFSCQEIKV